MAQFCISLHIARIHQESLCVFSMHRLCPRIILIRSNTFCVFPVSPYSSYTLKYFQLILHGLLHTFVYSPNTQKELRICRKKFSLLTMPENFNGTKQNWGGNLLAQDEPFTNFIFWLSLKTFCSLHIWRMRIAHIGKKWPNMKQIVDPFFLYQLGWIKPKNHVMLLSL